MLKSYSKSLIYSFISSPSSCQIDIPYMFILHYIRMQTNYPVSNKHMGKMQILLQ